MARIRYMDGTSNEWAKTSAILTASSAAAALPAAATQNPDRSYVWRSVAGTGSATLDVDFGAAVAVECIALANVKRIGAGVVELYQRGSAGSPVGGDGTLVATVPSQDRDTRAAAAFWASQSFRHWRIKFTNPGAASDYAEIGYVHLGTYFEPTANPIVPADMQRIDPSVETASIDGQTSTASRTKFYAGRWQFRQIPDAQLDQYRAMFDALGVSGRLFQVLDTSRGWMCWYAKFAGPLEVGLEVLDGRYALGQPWVEVR